MTTILSNRTVLLAKLEGTFREDALPSETLQTKTGIDATTDVDDSAETITIAGHGFTTGTGPVQVAVTSGALPDPLEVDTDYWVIRVDANTIKLATSRANAIAGTAIGLTDAVGVFTLAKVQSDALQVIEPDYAPDITVLDRDVARPSLSMPPGRTGRRMGTMTFRHEIKGNGETDGLTPPVAGVLLRGCGMQQVRFGETGSEEETILYDSPIPINDPTGAFTYAKTTGFAGTLPRMVILVCTTPGGSGVAEFSVYSAPVGSVQVETLATAQTMTDAGAFDLPESAQITPTITTSFASGDTFVIPLVPAGHYYEPVSENFESLTIYMFFEALRHRMTGARGTFTADGEAGAFGTFSFTFTGDFYDGEDSTFPTSPVFESQLPEQIELAALTVLGGKDFTAPSATGQTLETEVALCAQSFSVDIANEVNARDCINAPNSLEGAVITGRAPTASFNPETVLEAEAPFWSILSNASRVFWALRVGHVQGNVVTFISPYAQYTGLGYGNRNNIRNYDVTLRLAAETDAGNDEVRIAFS